MEKIIAELDRVVKMMYPHRPDSGFRQLHSPSKSSYREDV
jgi:hypothetical protein